MKNRYYVPLKLHPGTVTMDGVEVKIELPPRCKGILLAFETKKAAREFMGKDSELLEIEKNKGDG